jgi:bacterioferritin-associated ferredoxin
LAQQEPKPRAPSMIVCLCHRISDRDIHRNVEAGIRNFDLLQDETGLASACGCCHDCAREVFDAAIVKSSHGACPAQRSGDPVGLPLPQLISFIRN